MRISLNEPKVAELIERNSAINLCKADVSHIIDMGDGIIVDAEANGPEHLPACADSLMKQDNVLEALKGAKGIILFFWLSEDAELTDLQAAVETIRDKVPRNCKILLGIESEKTKNFTQIRAIIVG